MKKSFIISAIVLLAGMTACNKTDRVLSGAGQIRFAPTGVDTRAIVTDAAGLQAQTFQVYDFMGETKYIDDQITYNSTTTGWDYTTADFYLWKSGTHKMFGYTASAGELGSDMKVTFSKVLTTAADDQVDFLYSQIVTQDAAAWKAVEGNTPDTPVALNFKHTLSAVSVTIKNCTDKAVTLNSVSGPTIPNDGSVTVDFSGTAPAVTYATPAASTTPFVATAVPANTSVAADASADVLNAGATTKSYQVVWPQTIAKDAVTVTVSYTLNGTAYTDKVVALPATTWEPGKMYDYVLQILPTDVKLTFVVQDWEKVSGLELDTEDDSINMSNVTWMNSKVYVNEGGSLVLKNTVVDGEYSVYMYKDAIPAVLNKYAETVYQTYEEDVTDPDTGDVIHHAGDFVLDENDEKIVLHEEGDMILDEHGDPTYVPGTASTYTYIPAQAYFTVNYPNEGLFKIILIPAYGQTEEDLDLTKYQIMIYDSTLNPKAFRQINAAGEPIPTDHDTIYFQIRAVDSAQDGARYKAQVNILFKPAGSEDWISAYSEVRANYACVIPATN